MIGLATRNLEDIFPPDSQPHCGCMPHYLGGSYLKAHLLAWMPNSNAHTASSSNPRRAVIFAHQSPIYTPQSSPRSPSQSIAASRTVALAQDGSSSLTDLQADEGLSDWDVDQDDMEDRRPPLHRPTDGRSAQPLLHKQDEERGRPVSNESPDSAPARRPSAFTRRSGMRSRSPDTQAKLATRKKYTYAAFFLIVSLIAFTIQTETAEYIQRDLGWNKAYCMLYFTHGSWIFLWPFQLIILRVQKWHMPWKTFWRRHVYLVRTTAQMVEVQQLDVPRGQHSPIPYFIKMTAFVTCSLTVAGGSWYVAVNMTTPSDLTAIYNCSAFFAYAFSVPLLGEKLRWDKSFAVFVAIIGVLVVAYGGKGTSADPNATGPDKEAENRLLGNIIIGIGSVLYGLYEVLYKRLACPPEGTSPGRGMIFANTFGSLIGAFTLSVLWIPLPILHYTGLETFQFPRGEQAWMMLISVCANVTFSGCFLILISLTSPVLSSVAALLTIFMVAIVDWMLTGTALSPGAIIGGLLIIGAFLLLTWSTFKEMQDDRRKREADIVDSDESDKDDDP